MLVQCRSSIVTILPFSALPRQSQRFQFLTGILSFRILNSTGRRDACEGRMMRQRTTSSDKLGTHAEPASTDDIVLPPEKTTKTVARARPLFRREVIEFQQ